MARADRQRSIMEEQTRVARVVAREYSNVGFYTKLATPESVEKLDLARWKIEDMPHAFAHHPHLSAGASFILWINEGRLVGLEGFTNHGEWPRDEAAFRVAV